MAAGQALWLDGGKARALILWRPLAAWADAIAAWARAAGMAGQVVTVDELVDGEEGTRGTDIEGLPRELIVEAVKQLEGRGAAKCVFICRRDGGGWGKGGEGTKPLPHHLISCPPLPPLLSFRAQALHRDYLRRPRHQILLSIWQRVQWRWSACVCNGGGQRGFLHTKARPYYPLPHPSPRPAAAGDRHTLKDIKDK